MRDNKMTLVPLLSRIRLWISVCSRACVPPRESEIEKGLRRPERLKIKGAFTVNGTNGPREVGRSRVRLETIS